MSELLFDDRDLGELLVESLLLLVLLALLLSRVGGLELLFGELVYLAKLGGVVLIRLLAQLCLADLERYVGEPLGVGDFVDLLQPLPESQIGAAGFDLGEVSLRLGPPLQTLDLAPLDCVVERLRELLALLGAVAVDPPNL